MVVFREEVAFPRTLMLEDMSRILSDSRAALCHKSSLMLWCFALAFLILSIHCNCFFFGVQNLYCLFSILLTHLGENCESEKVNK